jgi:glyceraldehyde 3-phosphate dehydrogenase
MIRIAINGFGRIGRNFLRALVQDKQASEQVRVVAINVGPADPQKIVHMFTYDTIMGTFAGHVEMKGNMLHVNDQVMEVIAERDPEKAPWKRLEIDWVAECSGFFTKRDGASKHLHAGARHVLISAPAKGEDVSIVLGVNDETYDKNKHKIVSLGSCTTNALVPTLKILQDSFGIEHGFMTTVHAYTNTQVLLDVETDDLRRARAAALNIIPTTTGATDVLSKIIPELDGKIGGMSLRVPVAKVSLIDLAFVAQKELTLDALRSAFITASQSKKMSGIVGVTDEPLVSSDFSGNPQSVVIDMPLLDVRGNVGKVFGWYDNEWGYSERLKDFLVRVS